MEELRVWVLYMDEWMLEKHEHANQDTPAMSGFPCVLIYPHYSKVEEIKESPLSLIWKLMNLTKVNIGLFNLPCGSLLCVPYMTSETYNLRANTPWVVDKLMMHSKKYPYA